MDQLQLYYDFMKRWFLEQGDAAKGITPYLEVMLGALHRPIAEEEGASANNRRSLPSSNTSSLSETTDLPKEVMNVLEEKCGSEAFLNSYANLKLKALEKKMALGSALLIKE